MSEKKSIVVIMEGGLIQDIQNIPEGTEIEVVDFDAKDCGTDDEVCRKPGCYKETHYEHTRWTKEGSVRE
jgi:ribosomal protein L2